MNYDMIENLGKSVIQHGPQSSRIYLMKLHADDMPCIIKELDGLAMHKGYGKIFVKIRSEFMPAFEKAGYIQEAYVPGFFRKEKGCCFLGKFFSNERKIIKDISLIENIMHKAEAKAQASSPLEDGREEGVEQAGEKDAHDLADFYKQVFASYPFPIFEKQYIQKTMREDIEYYLVRDKKSIVAAGSSEIDHFNLNVEMTDFATLPGYRGQGLAGKILAVMEDAMRSKGVLCVYTIARAISCGINITFSRQGYKFGGILANNTNIAGSIESMNVWYRHL